MQFLMEPLLHCRIVFISGEERLCIGTLLAAEEATAVRHGCGVQLYGEWVGVLLCRIDRELKAEALVLKTEASTWHMASQLKLGPDAAGVAEAPAYQKPGIGRLWTSTSKGQVNI